MTKAEFAQLMGCEKTVIGMVHLLPLPGSPSYGGSMRAVFEAALRDLKALEGAGVKAAIIENFGFGELKDVSDPNALHEANLLMLNINKAKTRLGWKPRLNAKECAVLTSDWYKRYKTENVYDLCVEEINKFIG